MSQVLQISSPPLNFVACRPSTKGSSFSSSFFPTLLVYGDVFQGSPSSGWAALRRELRCQGRHSCLFADNGKQEQARKALENALSEKKTDFEKWTKEIEKRQERDGGGSSGRGGWFGGGGWFGWFGGEHFWEEAQQAILTIVGMISLYLLLAKGNVICPVVFNSLLFVLRGIRSWLTFVSPFTPRIDFALGPKSEVVSNPAAKEIQHTQLSAKERVIKKWAMD